MIRGSLVVASYWRKTGELALTLCLLPAHEPTNGIFISNNGVYARERFREYTLNSLSQAALNVYKDAYGSTPDFIAWNPK